MKSNNSTIDASGLSVENKLAPPIESPTNRYYVLFMLALVCALAYMDRFVLSVLIEPIKDDLNLSDTQIGLLTGFAFAFFYAVFGIPIARLADKSNRPLIISISVGFWSLMTVACGMSVNFIQLLLSRIGVGVGEAGCIPASHAILGDLFPGKEKAFAIGIFQAGGTVGILAGLILGGVLANSVGWQMTFIIIGLPGVLVGFWLWLTVKDTHRTLNPISTITDDKLNFVETIKYLLKQRTYRNLMLGLSLGAFGNYGIVQWLPSFLIRTHGMSLEEVGVLYGSVMGFGTLFGTLAGAFLAPKLIAKDQRWEVKWMACCSIVVIPLFIGCFLVDSSTLALGLLFIGVFTLSSGTGPSFAALQTIAGPKMKAVAVALTMLTMAILGQGCGPLVVGMISDILVPQFGEESLRYALSISMIILIWAAFHLFKASSTIIEDSHS
ncbi:spinster family MFS transporter [Shewanella aestuarii]|uniref:MFS transporter n=1 Tax=Shewanella aestuarii TaxID=1028752 RepID=A0A6G9QPS4_9GAMM|nr:MFS transporter [Shewanella aestuarii]QIR15821.1 MFS transporter [Shewanella aestuarii]